LVGTSYSQVWFVAVLDVSVLIHRILLFYLRLHLCTIGAQGRRVKVNNNITTTQ
jgi:hypothetical protein